MVERNAGLPPDRRIEFRIGVHLRTTFEGNSLGGRCCAPGPNWRRRSFCTNVPEKPSGLPAWDRGVSSWIGAPEGRSPEQSVCWR